MLMRVNPLEVSKLLDKKTHGTRYLTYSTRLTTRHTTQDLLHTAYSTRPTAHGIQHNTYNTQYTPRYLLHTTYNTAYNTRLTTYGIQHSTRLTIHIPWEIQHYTYNTTYSTRITIHDIQHTCTKYSTSYLSYDLKHDIQQTYNMLYTTNTTRLTAYKTYNNVHSTYDLPNKTIHKTLMKKRHI